MIYTNQITENIGGRTHEADHTYLHETRSQNTVWAHGSLISVHQVQEKTRGTRTHERSGYTVCRSADSTAENKITDYEIS